MHGDLDVSAAIPIIGATIAAATANSRRRAGQERGQTRAAAAAPLLLVLLLLLSGLEDAARGGPAQKAADAEDETPHDQLVLAAVALEADGLDIGLVGIAAATATAVLVVVIGVPVPVPRHPALDALADGQVLREAEGAGALRAGGGGGAFLDRVSFGVVGGGEWIEACQEQ